MKKAKYFTIGAVIVYVWYVYTGAFLAFEQVITGKLHLIMYYTAPLMWLGGEGAGAFLWVCAPIVFAIVTVIVCLLPEFTKKQKIALTIMPITAYALYVTMEHIAGIYLSYGAMR